MRHRLAYGSVALPLFVFAFAACGSDDSSTFNNNGASSSGASSSSSGGFESTQPRELCLPYVVSKENDLYTFDPQALTFTKVGRLDCPTAGNPTSMAIDRTGTAWVNYADGSLFKVSTKDASCAATSFAKNQKGFLKFGMAFATNGPNPTEETLYISGLVDPDGKGFGKIDLGTLTITMLGDYSNNLAKKAAEMTGTGDGHLYGFFTTQPQATLAEINRENGATSNEKSLAGVSVGNAFAQTFWGGDFWFYTAEGTSPSKVTQLRASGNGEIAVVVPDVGGFRIVGAGVSTCAPLTPPK